mgnify:FL=1
MNQEYLLKKLKEKVGNNSLKFPTHVKFHLSEKILEIKINTEGVTKNMQENASAFESWAIVLKYHLKEYIEKIIIDWEKPQNTSLHYNRFLYRAIKFEKNYDWVVLKGVKDDIEKIEREINNWVVNLPSKSAQEKAARQDSESALERKVLEILSADNRHKGQQLPTGLFKKQVSEATAITPGSNSCIDLWEFHDGEFRIYELKIDSNQGIGILSELMFYVNVMNDLKNGIIKYPQAKDRYRNIETIIEAIEKGTIKTIVGVFLTNKMHPLLAKNIEGIIEILNNNTVGILFEKKGISYDKINIVN